MVHRSTSAIVCGLAFAFVFRRALPTGASAQGTPTDAIRVTSSMPVDSLCTVHARLWGKWRCSCQLQANHLLAVKDRILSIKVRPLGHANDSRTNDRDQHV